MKEVLVDINELTDSREMYHSKPHPFVWIFTYILMGLIVTAVIWAAFSKKEIVVKAHGQVRPESGISTVRNILEGELESTHYKQGMTVKAGDILYIIKHDKLLMERESAEEKLKELENELENLKIYRNCITTEENHFDSINEPVYYEKVRKLLMDLRFSKTDAEYKTTRLSEEKILNSTQLDKNLKEIEYLKKYIKSLDNNKNYLNSVNELEKQYKQKYDKYLIAKAEIERKYDQQANDIKSNSLDAMKQSLEEEKTQLKAYETLKKSVSESKNNFSSGDRYSYLYTEYENRLNLLKNTYDEKKRIYEAYLSLSGIAVTKSELEDARVQMQNAQSEYTSYKSKFLSELEYNINSTEISIKEKESKISGTQDKQGLLNLNDKDRKNSLKALYLQERNAAAQEIDSLTDTVETLRQKNVLSDAELKTITDADGDNEDSLDYSLVERTKVQELVAADEKIKEVTDSITGVKDNIKNCS
ncbi:biotin/lipoyl-binding protein [Ruminiclostridium josui]|uniref:biotin/lipoyl-binding protein n=1 Tax=Ruminiclostridium josui TaxID=1499 RepID=UPI000A8F948C|nr:biotin/lipoyl-binding protein [Ruminiclostridium josui]